MRNRKIKASERQSASVLSGLYASIGPAASSTVKIYSKDRQVAMGSVVKSDGYVLTKLSEVENRNNVRVRLSNGSDHSATIVKTNSENDLAILKIAVADLPVVKWANVQPQLGAFLLTPSTSGKPLAIGSYSVRPRSTREGEQAFLGVQPIVTEHGVRVEEIQPGTASYAAGLQNGDVIINLGGHQIVDVSSLVRAIRGHRPGDKVVIKYRRKGVSQTTTATLAGAGIGGERAARFKMMNRLGAVPSRRDGNFPNVFQHDTPLFPEQCGGPIVDLDGQVVGLNIARKGRAASFALPSGYVRTLVDEMIRPDVASDSEKATTK
jgi:serine protease Do